VLRDQITTRGAPAAPAPLKFSAHAQTRLQSRSIPFGPEEVARLEAAVGKAQAKGSRESLVLMDGVALVVSVKNRTVITAVDAASLKDNVFTNIDSAVIC
jgi:flagellar operon protein